MADKKRQAELFALNGGDKDFSLWKANARGVDLNVNFAASWGKGKRNLRVAGAENYIGEKPFSEPETLTLKNFTQKIKRQEVLPRYSLRGRVNLLVTYWSDSPSTVSAFSSVAPLP